MNIEPTISEGAGAELRLLFKIKTANDWIGGAKHRPLPKKLFGDFWLEGELCILFADTGKGKSILAVQIADSIARGTPVEPMEMTAGRQSVLYLDFELSDKQFEMRYGQESEETKEFLENHYKFSDNFLRAEVDLERGAVAEDGCLHDDLNRAIRELVRRHEAKVLIVDNITFLNRSTSGSASALLLMRELKQLKSDLAISILVLAHTPKRELWRPIDVNDLQGSKNLANFADNIFTVGQSRFEPELRYIKHIKPRSTELLFDAQHVPSFNIVKKDGNFLSFKFDNFSPESEHLADYGQQVIRERIETANTLSEEGLSQRAIAEQMQISLGSVNRYLQMQQPE